MFLYVWSLLCNAAVISALFSFPITSLRTRELVALLKLFSCHYVSVSFLRLFLTVPWVVLQCLVVAFPDHLVMLWL